MSKEAIPGSVEPKTDSFEYAHKFQGCGLAMGEFWVKYGSFQVCCPMSREIEISAGFQVFFLFKTLFISRWRQCGQRKWQPTIGAQCQQEPTQLAFLEFYCAIFLC